MLFHDDTSSLTTFGIMKSALALFIALSMGTILTSCTAFSIQSARRISPRQQISVFHAPVQHGTQFMLNAMPAKPTSNIDTLSHLLRLEALQKIFRNERFVQDDDVAITNKQSSQVLQSFVVFVAFRRLAFLILSAALVQFFRSAVLKASAEVLMPSIFILVQYWRVALEFLLILTTPFDMFAGTSSLHFIDTKK